MIRGVFGRAGRMAPINTEDDTESDSDDESDADVAPTRTRRKQRVSGLVRLTGKQSVDHEKPKDGETPEKAGRNSNSRRQRQGSRTKSSHGKVRESTKTSAGNNEIEIVDIEMPSLKPSAEASKHGKSSRSLLSKSDLVISDSAGEDSDVWVISSEDDCL